MNKTAIKNFSVRARRKLIEEISQKAYMLGIKENGKHEEIEVFEGGFSVKNVLYKTVYPISKRRDRQRLIDEISQKGFEQVMEEVAYTWFNRIIAVRFMEVNEYLPVKVRILSSGVEGDAIPEIVTHIYDYVEAFNLDPQRVYDLKESHKYEELFREVFFKVCNQLGTLMPQVFEEIADYTELLLPDSLLVSESVIRDLVESIDEDDFKEEVEIIGWMYQYYISEKKDEVFAGLRKNKKITKENIPAATQLFTPKWIVQYMTENSLGRLWQESHPNEELKKKWEYYIEPAEQEPEVQQKLEALKNPNLNPEEITVLDPAMGSGHILVYAFDVLYDIYLSRGYMAREIPYLILAKNLFGLDIDDRAAQLASFALIMKARSKNRRLFNKPVNLNLYSIQESNSISKKVVEVLVDDEDDQEMQRFIQESLDYILIKFSDAKDYGSIINLESKEFGFLIKRVNYSIERRKQNPGELNDVIESLVRLAKLVKQAIIMSQSYEIVITNPPYKKISDLNGKIQSLVDNNYHDSKQDLYTVFMRVVENFLSNRGIAAMITQMSFAFKYQFKKHRKEFLNNTFINFLKLGSGTFEEIEGEVVQSATFVFRPIYLDEYFYPFIDVTKEKTSADKMNNLWNNYSIKSFSRDALTKDYRFINVTEMPYNTKLQPVKVKIGAQPGSNLIFRWWEVDFSNYKILWHKYNKGGVSRRWYGNHYWFIKYGKDGEVVVKNNGSLSNHEYYFREHISFTRVSSKFSFRYYSDEFIFDNTSPALFGDLEYLLAFYNSSVSYYLWSEMYGGNKIEAGHISAISPISMDNLKPLKSLVSDNVSIMKYDWDLQEFSFEFNPKSLFFINERDSRVQDEFINFSNRHKLLEERIKTNEKSINRMFYQLYSISSDDLIYHHSKLLKIDNYEYVSKYISYAVACIFGRYSLDEEGLIFAGGQLDISRYSQYIPTVDNILIITEEDYFENDVLHHFVKFLEVTFGKETLEENLRYIADVLYPKSRDTARDRIRRYFVKDFYKHHCKMYKNRPIYWMIDSGKKNGVKALFYMHRYDKNTIGCFRTDYLHEIQRYYENDIALSESTGDKKRADTLKKKLHEVTEFDKVVAHLAYQQIEFDLDDGVEHNYELLQNIEIPQADGHKPLKGNLLEKRK